MIDDWKKGIAVVIVMLGISGVLCHFRITFAYNLHMIPYWAALMLTGVLVHRYQPIQKGGENRVRGILISLVLLLSGAACSIYFGYGEQLFRGSFSNYTNEIPAMIILYITGLMATLGLSTILSIMEESGIILKEIIWTGTNSLYFYLFHMFFAWLISLAVVFDLRHRAYPPDFWKSLMISLASIACCAVYVWLREKVLSKPSAE